MAARLKPVAPVIPYVAVLTGLYILKSAWAAILFYHAGIVLVLALKRECKPRLWGGWNPVACAAGSVVCSFGGVLVYLLWPLVQRPDIGMDSVLAVFGLTGIKWWLFIAYFVGVHPVLEEVYWRSYLLSRQRRIDTVDFAFAGYHIIPLYFFLEAGWIALAIVVVGVTAWGWRLAVMRWCGLGVPVCTHAVADLSIIIAVIFLRGQ